MNKIPSVFLRDTNDMQVMTREINPLCQWVIDGEGVPTRKYDGTCVMRDESGGWWARREVKPGKETPPEFKLLGVDDITGKVMGYEPIENSGFYKHWIEALAHAETECEDKGWTINPGTYELCGPKINGNPEKYPGHYLVSHIEAEKLDWKIQNPEDATVHGLANYNQIKHLIQYLNEDHGWEGIVWHHPDGRMAKMKARDYRVESPE